MKKALLLLLPFLLGSCTTVPKDEETNTPSTPSTQEEQHQELPTEQEEQHQEEHTEGGGTQTEEEHTQGGGTETGGNTEGQGSETGGGTETGGGQQEEENPNPVTTNLSLDEWQNWYFSDGYHPQYVSGWDFYYGDSYEPNGCLWENPNNKDYSGMEFKKNCYLNSVKFNTYTKVEIRFYFWFSSHQSSSYNATKNEPQFKLEEYNTSNSLINTDDIFIERSDVPTNSTVKEIRVYVEQKTMTWFKLRFNNYVPNSQGGYSAILTRVGLKGYNY